MRNVREMTDGVRIEWFASLGDFTRFAMANDKPQSSNGNSESWAGTPTLQAAGELALKGWTEIRPEVDSIMSDLTERIANKVGDRFVTQHDVAGGMVDVGRFLAGHPACMMRFVPEPDATMGRVVKIAIAGTASHFIDPADIRRRGVAVCALVDTLHKLGLGVELWWDSTIRGTDGNRHSTVVKLHDSAEPLDIDNIMFALAHPSMLRRLVFSIQERSSKAKAQNVGGGYGVPADMGVTTLQDFDVIVEKLQDGAGDIVRDPFGWVISTVTGLGVLEGGE